MIMFLDHLMSALLAFFLLIQEYYDLHACLGLVATEVLWQTIQRHQNKLTDSLNMCQGLETHGQEHYNEQNAHDGQNDRDST
jgi:hypothetical protein